MTDLQKTLMEKILKASKYIQDAYFKQKPFRFLTKEEKEEKEEKAIEYKPITLDLFPKLNVKNIMGTVRINNKKRRPLSKEIWWDQKASDVEFNNKTGECEINKILPKFKKDYYL